MTFKERAYECPSCGARLKMLRWDTDPLPICPQVCGCACVETNLSWERNRGVVDDTIIGGRWVETLGHEPVWIESQSQLRREAEKRGLVNVVKHDDAYYAKQRKLHDERRRDTGSPYEPTERQPGA